MEEEVRELMDGYLTTEELSERTGIALDVLLLMLDLSLLARRVRLVRGRPMFAPSAVDAVRAAARIADEAVAAGLPAARAWGMMLEQTAKKST